MTTSLDFALQTAVVAGALSHPDERASRDPVGELLGPLIHEARVSPRLRYLPSPPMGRDARKFEIPHFIFNGPQGGGDTVRLGLFAAIHGDEPEGAYALVELLSDLIAHPGLAMGYRLHIYPVCNPTGFQAGTRLSVSRRDLNREFWRGSEEPEVEWLERELATRRFHGIVSLHSDDTADGVYAYARGALFSEALARPMLDAARRHLPPDLRERIDGFPACSGVIHECFDGILTARAVDLESSPFEVILETPASAPAILQVSAAKAALLAVLDTYRGFIGYKEGI